MANGYYFALSLAHLTRYIELMDADKKIVCELLPEPYLHLEKERIYNPLTDREISHNAPLSEQLLSWIKMQAMPESISESDKQLLYSQGWLISEDVDQDNRFRLMFVSMEMHTLCNQKCYFCPVSVSPRESYFMSRNLFYNILEQLTEFRSTLKAVFLHNYNEPTLSPNLVTEVKAVLAHKLPVAINTNGSGLTPTRVEELRDLGGLDYISINLSTLDSYDYIKTRGENHLPKVVRNIDYIAENSVAKRMDIAVLGKNDQAHTDAFKAIRGRYGEFFNVRKFSVNDRSGNIDLGMRYKPLKQLSGCDLVGSRPLQHIHINPYGKCILCCQDYAGKNELGDLKKQSMKNILSGSMACQYRRWVYGRDLAAEDFICRKCEFAISSPGD